MAVVEVAGGAGGFPEAAEAREEDALVVRVDAFVALVAFAGADIGRGSPARDVEAVDVEAFGVGHVAGFEPVVRIDGSAEEFRVMGFDLRIGGWISGEIEVHPYAR